MHRILIVPLLVAITGLGVLALGRSITIARQSTPAPASVGVTTEILGGGQPDAASGQALGVRRNTFAPDGFVPPHAHPGALVLHVESCELTYTVIEGTIQIQRGATAGTPGPTEHLGPGQETVLTLDYTMHEGMGGPHRFDVHLLTNDPAEPQKVLIAKSNWGP